MAAIQEMRDGFLSVNGKVSPIDKAQIPATDRGFLFADNIFETMVAFHGRILHPILHLDRLRRSAEKLRIDLPWSSKELLFELESLVEQSSFAKATIRLVVSRGNGFGLKRKSLPNRYIFVLPSPVESEAVYKNGIRLQLRTHPYTIRETFAKTGNYLESIIALHDMPSTYDEVLWQNSELEITEATTANIFFIGRHGDLVEITTPCLQSGILQGITRTMIIDVLGQQGIQIEEKVIFSDEIPRFDEAFLSSTVRGLIPVQAIGKHTLSSSRPQSLFNSIRQAMVEHHSKRLGFRIDWNSGEKLR